MDWACTNVDRLEGIFGQLAAKKTSEVRAAPERAAKQLQDAKDRYVFIKRPKPPT
jgi:hypothetical protein